MITPPAPKFSRADTQIGLCLDRGYRGRHVPATVAEHAMIAHVQGRDEEIKAREFDPEWRARRWVIERTHSWINRFRGLLIRWSKKTRTTPPCSTSPAASSSGATSPETPYRDRP